MTAENIQRNFTTRFDFRNEAANERKTIYEIGANSHYTLVHKRNGEVIGLHHAQNTLTLILKHITGNGWTNSPVTR